MENWKFSIDFWSFLLNNYSNFGRIVSKNTFYFKCTHYDHDPYFFKLRTPTLIQDPTAINFWKNSPPYANSIPYGN